MSRLPLLAVLLALVSPLPALAQTASGTAARNGDVTGRGVETGPTSAGQPTTAPRNPGGVTAGTNPANQGRMNSTVGQISGKLLNEEKSRPNLPGQAPSPSQTMPGGTASTPH